MEEISTRHSIRSRRPNNRTSLLFIQTPLGRDSQPFPQPHIQKKERERWATNFHDMCEIKTRKNRTYDFVEYLPEELMKKKKIPSTPSTLLRLIGISSLFIHLSHSTFLLSRVPSNLDDPGFSNCESRPKFLAATYAITNVDILSMAFKNRVSHLNLKSSSGNIDTILMFNDSFQIIINRENAKYTKTLIFVKKIEISMKTAKQPFFARYEIFDILTVYFVDIFCESNISEILFAYFPNSSGKNQIHCESVKNINFIKQNVVGRLQKSVDRPSTKLDS